jgi:hypothetical protein
VVAAKRLAAVSAPQPSAALPPASLSVRDSFDTAATRLAAIDFMLPLSAEVVAALQEPKANLIKKAHRNIGSRIDWDRRENASAKVVRILLPFVGLACQLLAAWKQPWTGAVAVPLTSGTAWLLYGPPAGRRAKRRLSKHGGGQEPA